MHTPATSTPADYNTEGATFRHFTTPGPDNGQLAEFTENYLEAAFMLAEEEVREATASDLAGPDLAHIENDCKQFLGSAFAANLLNADSDFSQAGTDYFLTRNEHGTGFWDRPELYGDSQADALSELAQADGPADLIRGDNGQVYHYPPPATLQPYRPTHPPR